MGKSEGAGGLGYFLKWQTPVCALIIVIPAAVAATLIKKRLRTQGCLKSSEKSHTETEEDTFLKDGLENRKSAATSRTTERSGTNLHNKHSSGDESSQKAGFLGHLMHIVYQTSAGASLLTDLVFWTILVPMMAGKQFQLTLVIGSIHSVNAIFLAIDSLLNALVSCVGSDPHSMLRCIHIARESQRCDVLKVVPSIICEVILALLLIAVCTLMCLATARSYFYSCQFLDF
ncbi:hypothetical protein Cgig2_019345 [Carnegiea gigantea]|uniref:Uncharacterized protein n=1 Tax=Carnegiea gigantea TaxID=171969 RepID=A0A9Q1KNF2_9CARY|nr:hypothetical protein Cgig2_019345 [Carnegiea gigantea]